MKRTLLILLGGGIWVAVTCQSTNSGWKNRQGHEGLTHRRLFVDTAALDYAAGVAAADTNTMVGVDRRSGALTVLELATGARRAVVEGETVNSVGPVSPDGRLIAYTACTLRNGSCDWELRSVALDGSSRRTIVAFGGDLEWLEPHAWTSDGQRIVGVATMKGQARHVAFASTNGGTLDLLVPLEWRTPTTVALSPNGQSVAYDYQPDRDLGDRDIYVLDLQTQSQRRLTRGGMPKTVLGWTGDGGGVLYSTGEHEDSATIWLADIRSENDVGTPRKVLEGIAGLGSAHMLRGSLVYIVGAARRSVYATSVDLEAGRVVSSPELLVREAGLGARSLLSPDGSRVAWSRALHIAGGDRSALIVLDRQSRRRWSIPLPLTDVLLEAWNSDGKAIRLAGSARGERSRYGVDVGDIGTSRKSGRLTMLSSSRVATSPDGATVYVILVDSVGGRSRVIARNVATGGEAVLYEAPDLSTPLYPSPDGTKLAISRGGPRSRPPSKAGFVVVATRAAARILFSSDTALHIGQNSITWTPDSRHVLFRVGAQGPSGEDMSQLWSATLGAAAPRLLLSVPYSAFREGTIQLTSDGRGLLYTAGPDDPPREIWLLGGLFGADARR